MAGRGTDCNCREVSIIEFAKALLDKLLLCCIRRFDRPGNYFIVLISDVFMSIRRWICLVL